MENGETILCISQPYITRNWMREKQSGFLDDKAAMW